MSFAHDLLMLGPVGDPLEDFTDASPSDSFWHEHVVVKTKGGKHQKVDGDAWTVERIGRRVYTFSLDDMWEARTASADSAPGEGTKP